MDLFGWWSEAWNGLGEIGKALGANGWADLLGTIGSIVALLGLPAAWYQAYRAKTAAEAARRAAEDARQELIMLESMASLSSLVPQLESLKDVHRRNDWPIALYLYGKLRRELIAVREQSFELGDHDGRSIDAMVKLLGKLESAAEHARAGGQTPFNIKGLNAQLTKRLDALQKVVYAIRRRRVAESDNSRET